MNRDTPAPETSPEEGQAALTAASEERSSLDLSQTLDHADTCPTTGEPVASTQPCGARTLNGRPCRRRDVEENGLCEAHGGLLKEVTEGTLPPAKVTAETLAAAEIHEAETGIPTTPELIADLDKKARSLARMATEPNVNAAMAIVSFGSPFGALQLEPLVHRLRDSLTRIEANDMEPCEAMLWGQAQALQMIFTNLGQKAGHELGQRPDSAERLLRMALKAQNQCRMTIESLATLKNPTVVVAQQTNIANGPQQVNNAVPDPCSSRRGASATTYEREREQNELLEVKGGERLDT